MNLPAELLNLFDSLKVDPDSLSRLKGDLYVQCGSKRNAVLLLSKLGPMFQGTMQGEEVTVFDVVQ